MSGLSLPEVEQLGQFPDKPPRVRRAGSPGGRPRKESARTVIIDGFTGLGMLVGALIRAFNEYDGNVLIAKSHDMAVTLEQVAHHYPGAYRWLLRIAGANDFTAVFMSFGGVAYAIAANHGAVPVRPVQMFDLPLPPEREATPTSSQVSASPGGAAFGPQYASPQYAPFEQAIPMGPASNPPMSDDIAAAVRQELEGKPGLVLPGGYEAMVARIREESLRQQAALQASAARQGPEGMPTVNPNGGL